MTNEEKIRVLREALQAMHDNKKEYIEINHLGHPYRDFYDMRMARDALSTTKPAPHDSSVSIDMLLWCPRCHAQHVDQPSGDWTNPPHKSHLCHECGTIWRPADIPTNGVAEIQIRGTNDTYSRAARGSSASTPPLEGEE